jgi:hypothetical protein
MIIMVLKGIQLSIWSSTQVIRNFHISEIDTSQIFVILVVVNEADPLKVYLTLFLFSKIIAMVEWDTPG